MLNQFKQLKKEYLIGNYIYDNREIFIFKDGGQIYLDFKGEGFKLNAKKRNSIVFIALGIQCDS